ncbi:MAG: nitric oxide reductase activation protein NorD [Bdellovibrio bacteriovorus]
MSQRPLNAAELEERMDVHLDPALSSRRTAAQPAADLAAFPRREQEFVLHWGAVIARDNAELAYQFTAFAPQAMDLMDLESVESWLLYAMDLYDKKGQMPAIRAFQEVADFAANQQEKLAGRALEDCAGVLERFVCGLNGRPLKILPGERTFTDTETCFLPPVIGRLPDKEANFRLYKAMTVHQWAQNWYGTWRAGVLLEAVELARLTGADLALFHALEQARLDACIARDFPGLHRDMAALRRELDPDPRERDPDWWALIEPLEAVKADVADSLRLAMRLGGHPPLPCCYRGELDPMAVRTRLEVRAALERDRFRIALAQLLEDRDGRSPGEDRPEAETLPESRERLGMRHREDPDSPNGVRFELFLDGNPVAPPEDVISTMESIIQDHGEIPPEYLVAAGPGLYKRGVGGEAKDADSAWAGAYHEEGAFLYDEWDLSRQHHRKGWCVLREHEVRPDDPAFYHRTLRKYGGLIKSIRRTFEVLRGEDRIVKRQHFGEDVDIDALVDAYADVHAGLEMTDRLFSRLHKDERHIAVMLMVDMSGSTKGWINEAEREALILLCEALNTLGDRFAIYGFSGWTRKRCEVYPVKRFGEPYDEDAKGRICGISPRDYTRMGAPIRHLTRILGEQEARTKLLITLSDGKPDDYDHQYRGEYGIEDTRQALFEARREGVHPFCITIDEQGADYLPHMYGPANFTVIADVTRLPLKVSDIYRKLTS